MTKTHRDYEYDYLSVSYQIEDLLQRKTAAYSVQQEIEESHARLAQLARQIETADDPRNFEYDYLAVAYKIQDLLQQKTQAYSLSYEFQAMQNQLNELSEKLEWNGASSGRGASNSRPHLTDRLSRLQSEIQELRSQLG